MPGEQHAEPAWVEVERVGHGRAGKRMPRNNYLEGEALQAVRRVDSHAREPGIIQQSAQEIFLVVVGHPDGDIRRPEIGRAAVLAGRPGAPGEQSVDQIADKHGGHRVSGQDRRAGKGDMRPAVRAASSRARSTAARDLLPGPGRVSRSSRTPGRTAALKACAG